MANYQDNRIICNAFTAQQLITAETEEYFHPIDFGKALGTGQYSKPSYTVSYGEGVEIDYRENGLVDIGFCTRWYTDLETINAFISKYHEAEWWIQQDWVDVYHYYWANDEVIEDIHAITEEESDYLLNTFDEYCDKDDVRKYAVIFTEKIDQTKYVNLHPDIESDEYKEYLGLVENIADRIVSEDKMNLLKRYDYNWEGATRYFSSCMTIRTWYLYEMNIDREKYKLNIMSEDVLKAVQRRLYPYDKKLYDAVFGLAIGDALGVPYEFNKRGSFECKGMIGYGTHNQPPGTWSDDTSMTLATLKSIKDNGGKIAIDDIRHNFLLWLNEGKFTVDGNVFDVGNATYKALKTGKPCVEEYENGNGSLMRILPLAFVECTDDEIRAVSAITHGHWISMEACVIYVHVARRLLNGERIEDIIPTLKYEKPFDRLCILDKLEKDDIHTSGYVVDTLEAALWGLVYKEKTDGGCLIKCYNYDILRVINLGEDTDTTGAVTGGLLGIDNSLNSYSTEDWFETLRNKDLIKQCLW